MALEDYFPHVTPKSVVEVIAALKGRAGYVSRLSSVAQDIYNAIKSGDGTVCERDLWEYLERKKGQKQISRPVGPERERQRKASRARRWDARPPGWQRGFDQTPLEDIQQIADTIEDL